jgi:hypothetical protein
MALNGFAAVFPTPSTVIDPFLQAAGLSFISLLIFQLFDPVVRNLPYARENSPWKSAALGIYIVLLNALLVVGVAAAKGTVSMNNSLSYLVATLAQAAVAYTEYRVLASRRNNPTTESPESKSAQSASVFDTIKHR